MPSKAKRSLYHLLFYPNIAMFALSPVVLSKYCDGTWNECC